MFNLSNEFQTTYLTSQVNEVLGHDQMSTQPYNVKWEVFMSFTVLKHTKTTIFYESAKFNIMVILLSMKIQISV